jgi:hypothetical protein
VTKLIPSTANHTHTGKQQKIEATPTHTVPAYTLPGRPHNISTNYASPRRSWIQPRRNTIERSPISRLHRTRRMRSKLQRITTAIQSQHTPPRHQQTIHHHVDLGF